MDIEKLKVLKILYVEDEIELRETTCNSLGTLIPDITVAANGREGYEAFGKAKFDLVITDLSMPVMDGIEMIKEIRKTNSATPILVTTAFGSQSENVAELSKIGMTEYIMKPVDMMILVKAIDKLIS